MDLKTRFSMSGSIKHPFRTIYTAYLKIDIDYHHLLTFNSPTNLPTQIFSLSMCDSFFGFLDENIFRILFYLFFLNFYETLKCRFSKYPIGSALRITLIDYFI